MTNTVLLSALTMVALTGITLTSLKYRHDSEHSDVIVEEDYADITIDPIRYNPKILYYDVHDTNHSKGKSVSKRSINDHTQYSIDSKNELMVDEFRREKVKQVLFVQVHGPLIAKTFNKIDFFFVEHLLSASI